MFPFHNRYNRRRIIRRSKLSFIRSWKRQYPVNNRRRQVTNRRQLKPNRQSRQTFALGFHNNRRVRQTVRRKTSSTQTRADGIEIEKYTSSIQKDLRHIRLPSVNQQGNLQWPQELTPIFVISMRAQRFVNLQQRMQQWSSLLQLIPATQGTKIDLGLWRKTKRLQTESLTRGQIGCYESHVRAWQTIRERQLPHALVIEDDADITYSQRTVDRLNEMLGELHNVGGNWEVVYVGSIGLHPIKRKVSEHLEEPSDWEGLYTYYVSHAGARKLLENAYPIRMPVDIYVADQMKQGRIRLLKMSPPLNFVVSVSSDTDVKT